VIEPRASWAYALAGILGAVIGAALMLLAR
jgi:hypothetical protein